MAVYYAVLANAAIAASIPLAKKYLHPLEIGAVMMFACILNHIVFSLVTLNLKTVEPASGPTSFWFLELYHIVAIPSSLVWLMALYSGAPGHWGIKPLAAFVWVSFYAYFYELCRMWGFLDFKQWNLGWSLVKWAVIVVGVSLFFGWFRRLFLREGEAV